MKTGFPLHWPTRNVSYVLNEEGFPGLSDAAIRTILKNSFGVWEGARCSEQDSPFDASVGGGDALVRSSTPIGLKITQERGTTPLRDGPKADEPNDNAIAHVPADDWAGDRHAFAITKIWFNRTNGIILGADMLFNGGMDPFGICPSEGCRNDELTDLANVVTHEAGHFLGLAHSDVPGATMWCDAAPGDVDKRDLTPDDIEGICAIYGPNADLEPEGRSSSGGGCSLQPAQRGERSLGLWSMMALVGFGVLRRRARRAAPSQ